MWLRLGKCKSIAALVVAGTALAVGCSRPAPASVVAVPANVLIVTIDTLRADRLGVYGAKNVQTPVLDRLARFGRFEIVIACDVTNSLTGGTGAARVYGPQKGATSEDIQLLDAALMNPRRSRKEDRASCLD